MLAIEIDLSLPSKRGIRVLDRLVEYKGIPMKIRMDNGPEFISVELAAWAEKKALYWNYPARQADAERLYRTLQQVLSDRSLGYVPV